MTLNEIKYQIVHMGQQFYRFMEDMLESCSAEKDVGVLVNCRCT